MSLSAYPHDDTMPGTPIAVDPSAMRVLLAEALRRTSRLEYAIEECRLLRIHYRPAVHCFVHYAVGLVEAHSGRRSEARLTGLIYPDNRAQRRLGKILAASAGQPGIAGTGPFEPAFYLATADMVVQTFPCDRRLSSLPRIIAGAAPDIDAMLVGALGTGDWRIGSHRVEPVTYRALSGAVMRYAVEVHDAATGRRRGRSCYVKAGRIGESEREARLLEALRVHARSNGRHFDVPDVVGYLPEPEILIVESAPGRSLERIVVDGGDSEGASRRAARGLADFHLCGMAPDNALDAVVDRARVAADYVGWACPALVADLGAIIGGLEAQLRSTDLGPAHLDLKPDHIFLDGDRVVFIDVSSFGAADPVLDVATLLERLAALPFHLGVSTWRVEAAANALADEYFKHVPRDWRSRLDVNRAVARMQVASEFFRHQHPEWRELVPAWVAPSRPAGIRRQPAMEIPLDHMGSA